MEAILIGAALIMAAAVLGYFFLGVGIMAAVLVAGGMALALLAPLSPFQMALIASAAAAGAGAAFALVSLINAIRSVRRQGKS